MSAFKEHIEGLRAKIPLAVISAWFLIWTVTWAVFGRALSHDFLNNWDDPAYILHNEAIKGFTPANLKTVFSSFYVGNYAPVQMMSYMMDYTIWGLNASGFIGTNITLHAINGILLYTLLKKLGDQHLPALFGSLIFIVHPVQVESVVWVSQRKNLLAMTLFIAAFILYCKWRERSKGLELTTFGLSLFSFILALLTKSVTIVLPLVLLVYDWTFLARERWQTFVATKLPYFFAALLVGGVALVSQTQEAGGGRAPYHGGSIWSTGLTMLPVLVRYFRLIFWPSALSAIYDPPIKNSVDTEVLLAFVFISLLLALAVYLYRRSPRDFFWYSLVFIGLIPVSQIVPIITLMNDRYLYFPMMGVAGLCSSIAGTALLRLPQSFSQPVKVVCIAVIASLSLIAWNRTAFWENSFLLWTDAVTKSPGSSTAWSGLAEAYHNNGQLDDARFAYLRSLSLKPTNPETVNNLGVLFLDRGEIRMARQFLVPLVNNSPDNFSAILNLGDSYFMEGNLAEAERLYLRAHTLKPAAAKPMVFLGGMAMLRGDVATAEAYFAKARQAGMGADYIAFYKASILSRTGHAAEAISFLKEAIRLGYDDFSSMSWDRYFDPIRGSVEYQQLLRPKYTKK